MTNTFIDLLEPSQAGLAKLEQFTVQKKDIVLENMRLVRDLGWWARIKPGSYWRVSINGRLQMSNTSMEINSNKGFGHQAHGEVLVFGLGLGLMFDLVNWDMIKHMTVVEISKDVIDLMTPFINRFEHADKITVIQGNALVWENSELLPMETVYFDIWPQISVDNIPEMEKLIKKANTWVYPDAWIGCWSEPEIRSIYYCSDCEELIEDCGCDRCYWCEELVDECICDRCDYCDNIMDECECETCNSCGENENECICEDKE